MGADIKRAWNEGSYGEAIGKTVAGTIGAVTTPVIDGAVNAGSAVAGFGRGLFGIGADAPAPAAAPAAATPAAGTAVARGGVAPAAPIAAGATVGAGAGEVNPQTAAPAPNSRVVDGVYNHGRAQYSDQAGGMGFPAGFTGKPNTQNNAAAGALAQSEAGGFGLKRPAQPEPGGFGLDVPAVSHSGNDWAARQRLKNLETSASSIMNTQRWGGRGAANNPAAQNFLDASRADLAAQGKEPDMQMRTNEVNAGLRRAAMAEAGLIVVHRANWGWVCVVWTWISSAINSMPSVWSATNACARHRFARPSAWVSCRRHTSTPRLPKSRRRLRARCAPIQVRTTPIGRCKSHLQPRTWMARRQLDPSFATTAVHQREDLGRTVRPWRADFAAVRAEREASDHIVVSQQRRSGRAARVLE